MKIIKSLLLIIGLSVSFGSGWLVSEGRNTNKVSPSTIWANEWKADIALLTRNVRNPDLNEAKEVVLLIGFRLNANSIVLSREYDNLDPWMKKSMVFYANSAQIIARAQAGTTSEQNRRDLLAFAVCIGKDDSTKGFVERCVKEQTGNVK
jgi:hypothetical protein